MNRSKKHIRLRAITWAVTIALCGMAGCSKLMPFQKQVYRAVDDKAVITLNSSDELELSTGGSNLVCKYSREDDKLRVIINAMGSVQAVYFQVIPEGLKDPDGTILYEPKQYESVINKINADADAARNQAPLRRSQARAILNEARMIDSAIDKLRIENNKMGSDTITSAELKGYFKEGSRLYVLASSGAHLTDTLNNNYIYRDFDSGVKVSPATIDSFSDVIDSDTAFWGAYMR